MTTSRLIATLTASAAASAVLALAPLAPASADGLLPPLDGTVAAPGSEAGAPTATAAAPDGRLHGGCRDYPVRYAVRDAGDDWLLDLVVRDRSGEEVAAISLHAVEHGARGWAEFTVCRSAVEAGRFTVGGVLTERDGYEQTEHPVERSAFRLTRH